MLSFEVEGSGPKAVRFGMGMILAEPRENNVSPQCAAFTLKILSETGMNF